MTAAASLWPLVRKEGRALVFPWLACLVALVVPFLLPFAPRVVEGLPAVAYLVGVAVLGAMSIGHEYTSRTLSLLLTLPARRDRLLTIKLGVLGAMLLVTWATVVSLGAPASLATVVALCALCLAPWMTMVTRSELAGAVFAMAVPGVVLVVGEGAGLWLYAGRAPDEMLAFRMAVLWVGTVGLCAVGAVMGWRTFMRLETIDGPARDVLSGLWQHSAATIAETRPRARRPTVWQLVMKELRLQQMAFALAGLYVLGWLIVTASGSFDGPYMVMTFVHMGAAAFVIGSVASAGERELGTLEWQVLLPLATSAQWAVKVGVAVGVTLLLSIGLPAVLVSLTPFQNSDSLPWRGIAVMVVLVTTGSLYVSSLSRTGFRALLMSMSTVLGGMTLVSVTLLSVTVRSSVLSAAESSPWVMRGLTVGVTALLLLLALTNHRSAEPAGKRALTQALLLGAVIAAGPAIAFALHALL